MKKKIAKAFLMGLIMTGVFVLAACVTAEAEQSSVTLDEQTKQELKEKIEAGTGGEVVYRDGIYSGSAEGFRDDLTVEVEIADGLISSVAIVSHNEVGKQFYQPAMDLVPGEIIAAQSVEVDNVSGATYTSVGIKNAVLDALNQAVKIGILPKGETLPTGGYGHH